MTAPAIVLLADGPDEPAVGLTLESILTSLRNARPDLRVRVARLGDIQPRLSDVVETLVRDDVGEAVIVPLSLVTATAAGLEDFTHSPDIHVAIARPVGPASELLNILDERVRDALHRGGALEIDGLILAAPPGGDLRGNALLARRARQWATHHRLPVQLTLDDGDGRATATAVAQLRGQGRRHIAVGCLHLAGDSTYTRQAQAALRAGAIAVTAPIGDSEHLRLLIMARYAFGAMELLDGTPTQLGDDELEGEDL